MIIKYYLKNNHDLVILTEDIFIQFTTIVISFTTIPIYFMKKKPESCQNILH